MNYLLTQSNSCNYLKFHGFGLLIPYIITCICCLQGYEVHVYDSVTNQTSYLGNTTETYFRINTLLLGHNYTFSVQARCLLSSQLCGEPALLLYNQLAAGRGTCTYIYTKKSVVR